MAYKMKTIANVVFTINQADFNPANYIEELNKESVLMIAVGDILTQKHNIQSIYPVREEGETPVGVKLDILTNQTVVDEKGESQSEILTAYAEKYNSGEISADFNNGRTAFVLVGDVIVHKRNANIIMPAKTEEETVA